MARCLAQTDVAGNHRVKDHWTEVAFQFFVDLIGQAQTRVIHGQQKAFDLDLRIEFRFDDTDGVEKLGDSLQCEIFSLHGNDHGVCRGQCVDRYKSERRRAVDQYVVILVLDGSDCLFQYILTRRLVDKLNFSACQVDARPDKIKPLAAGGYLGSLHRIVIDQTFVDRRGHSLRVYPVARCCVGLRIGVNYQCLLTLSRK